MERICRRAAPAKQQPSCHCSTAFALHQPPGAPAPATNNPTSPKPQGRQAHGARYNHPPKASTGPDNPLEISRISATSPADDTNGNQGQTGRAKRNQGQPCQHRPELARHVASEGGLSVTQDRRPRARQGGGIFSLFPVRFWEKPRPSRRANPGCAKKHNHIRYTERIGGSCKRQAGNAAL